jgi:hypothetical protein
MLGQWNLASSSSTRPVGSSLRRVVTTAPAARTDDEVLVHIATMPACGRAQCS